MKRILGLIFVLLAMSAGIASAQIQSDLTPSVTATVDGSDIVVSWEAIPGAATYSVWAWTESTGWTRLAGQSETSYRHTGLAPGTSYWYSVRAESAYSEYVSAQVPETDSPPPTATPTPTPAPTATPTPTPTPEPESEIDGITIAPENRCSEYDSDDYSYPQSVEADIVAGMDGRIYGPYTGTYFDSTSETDIEHIVARSEAHDSGLCSATEEERRTFSRDLVNLTLASPSVNRHQKSAKDVAEWLPALNQCWYVNQVVVVKRKYSLTMDQAEADKAQEVLSGCTSTAMIFVEQE